MKKNFLDFSAAAADSGSDYAFTTVFLWFLQTRLAENNAVNLLRLHISNVRKDINDASNANFVGR